MSKSIYQEAIEDLYYVIPVGYPKDMIGKTTQTKRLLEFVKQAEKQEKLLELYKELSFIYEQLYTVDLSELIENKNYYQNKITKIKQQIKETEL